MQRRKKGILIHAYALNRETFPLKVITHMQKAGFTLATEAESESESMNISYDIVTYIANYCLFMDFYLISQVCLFVVVFFQGFADLHQRISQ